MKKYSTLDLVLDSNLKSNGNKKGFYGFEYLIPFSNLEELKALAPIKKK